MKTRSLLLGSDPDGDFSGSRCISEERESEQTLACRPLHFKGRERFHRGMISSWDDGRSGKASQGRSGQRSCEASCGGR
ncbi:hypothetical protein ACLOJK_018478 [Asimina triloba]